MLLNKLNSTKYSVPQNAPVKYVGGVPNINTPVIPETNLSTTQPSIQTTSQPPTRLSSAAK
jgi:hypothetical protein